MDKKHILILLADGFEEIESVVPYDLLVRAGFTVKTVSFSSGVEVRGSRGLRIIADKHKSEISIEKAVAEGKLPHAIILPGGLEGTKNLAKDSVVGKIVTEMHKAGKIVAAICAAPIVVLSPLGLLKQTRYTCYPGMEQMIEKFAGSAYPACVEKAVYVADTKVVQDKNLITGSGPGAASDFAFKIIEFLASNDSVKEIKEDTGF